jgi:hypothetical protein
MKEFHNQNKKIKYKPELQQDITNEGERNISMARNNRCKDMHPYQLIEKIRAVQ